MFPGGSAVVSGPFVQRICTTCGVPYLTRTRGNTTHCPACGSAQYVPVRPDWQGPDRTPTGLSRAPALYRFPVRVECTWCGHAWQTRAAPGTSLRCPARTRTGARCGHSTRVPSARYVRVYARPGEDL